MALSKPADELRLKAIELLNNLVAQGSDDDAQSGRRRLEASQPSVSSNVLASWQRRSSSESQRAAVEGRLEHRRYSDASLQPRPGPSGSSISSHGNEGIIGSYISIVDSSQGTHGCNSYSVIASYAGMHAGIGVSPGLVQP